MQDDLRRSWRSRFLCSSAAIVSQHTVSRMYWQVGAAQESQMHSFLGNRSVLRDRSCVTPTC